MGCGTSKHVYSPTEEKIGLSFPPTPLKPDTLPEKKPSTTFGVANIKNEAQERAFASKSTASAEIDIDDGDTNNLLSFVLDNGFEKVAAEDHERYYWIKKYDEHLKLTDPKQILGLIRLFHLAIFHQFLTKKSKKKIGT